MTDPVAKAEARVGKARRVLAEHQRKIDAESIKREDERLKGFVSRNHRCEQWSSVTYIPPDAVKAIEERARKGRKGKRCLL